VVDSPSGFSLKPWQQFHVRVTLFNGAVVFVVLAVMGIVFYDLAYSTEFSALQERLRSTVSILARRIDPATLDHVEAGPGSSKAFDELRTDLTAICRDDRDIYSVYILKRTAEPRVLTFVMDVGDDDADLGAFGERYEIRDETALMERGLEEVTVEDRMSSDQWGLTLGGYAPLRYPDGRPFGLIGVDVNASHIDAMQERILLTTLAIFGAALIALTSVAFVVGRRIRGPIASINDAAGKIARGDFEHELALTRRDEFGLMGHHFNTISKSLKERDFLRDTFGRYVSPDIAKRVLSDRSAGALGGEDRDVTVVFSDIEGYSTMTELIPPQQVLGMLNTYLAAMNEIIDRHQGCIIEFLGDAILAVFNAPNDIANHPEVGVKCALEMRARLEALNEEWANQPIAEIWRKAGKERLKARTGIHSGHVVAGNLGSKTRMKYGLIGDVVNVAARIEALNKPLTSTLLVSADVHARLGPELQARATDRGEFEVKGRANLVKVWGF
jgi:class 3 adenylate cyclase